MAMTTKDNLDPETLRRFADEEDENLIHAHKVLNAKDVRSDEVMTQVWEYIRDFHKKRGRRLRSLATRVENMTRSPSTGRS